MSKEVALAIPDDPMHGDLTTSVALQVGRELGKSPREIAQAIVHSLEEVEDIEKVQIAGPGFLNITLTIAARLKQLLRSQAACEPKEPRKEPPVILEYSQPNIAKPLGVHHILSTVIGQAVANLYRHLGYNVIAWNYIGDWGTQFGKLAVAVEKWGTKGKEAHEYTLDEFLDLYVRFHEEVKKNPALDDMARDIFRRLERGEPAVRAFWADVTKSSMRDIQKIYDRLHVRFDVTKGESAYEDAMAPILEEGREKGVFREGEGGALIVEFPKESGLPIAMVLKADGGTLYLTRELALARDRAETYHPKMILHFVDTAQELYFRQLIATIERLQWDIKQIEHVVLGRMSFPDKAMSTRKGNIISLEDALDEAVRRADVLIAQKQSEVEGSEREDLAEIIGVGALVYGVLSHNRRQNIVFSWEKALTFEGNSGPYLQYTFARARSVLRKAGIASNFPAFAKATAGKQFSISNFSLDPELGTEGQFETLSNESLSQRELLLMREMSKFPEVLEEARAAAMPHPLTNYLFVLSQAFNAFYNALPILQAPEPLRMLRLALTNLTASILKVGAQILTLRVPERM